jgi:hypothetical protein
VPIDGSQFDRSALSRIALAPIDGSQFDRSALSRIAGAD